MGSRPAWCLVLGILATPMTAGAQTSPPDGASLTRIEVGGGLVTGISIEDGPRGRNRLHGPDLDPPPDGIRAARVRYRWLGAVTGERISVLLIVRPPVVTAPYRLAGLSWVRTGLETPPPVSSGDWIEQELTHHAPPSPPYSVEFAMMAVDGHRYFDPLPVHGTIEIDWIALVR